jgi:hypothetical protein
MNSEPWESGTPGRADPSERGDPPRSEGPATCVSLLRGTVLAVPSDRPCALRPAIAANGDPLLLQEDHPIQVKLPSRTGPEAFAATEQSIIIEARSPPVDDEYGSIRGEPRRLQFIAKRRPPRSSLTVPSRLPWNEDTGEG